MSPSSGSLRRCPDFASCWPWSWLYTWGVFAVAPSAVSGARADAHRDSGSERVAGAEHILAIPGIAASGGSAATAGGQSAHAATSLGSGSRALARSHPGHRHDDTNGVRSPDGRTQRLQPPASWEEKLSAHPD